MAHIEFLSSLCPLRDLSVVDIGAGDGVYSKQLDAAGAKVTAVEIDADKVSNARSHLPPSVDVRLGAAQTLPLEDNSKGLACFFFSLHHVPAEVQHAAFDEVCRVVRPGGRLHVVEPYPFGTMFDLVRLVEDETVVRTDSHELLKALDRDPRFNLLATKDYTLMREFPTFDNFVDRIVRPDAERSATYEGVATAMEETYERVIENVDGARVLHQPCAAYHFELGG